MVTVRIILPLTIQSVPNKTIGVDMGHVKKKKKTLTQFIFINSIKKHLAFLKMKLAYHNFDMNQLK